MTGRVHMHSRPWHPASARSQRGLVLVVALIVMAVIAITAGTAMKEAIRQDQIGGHMRTRSMALQEAESALRYCEAIVATPTPTPEQSAAFAKVKDVIARNFVAPATEGSAGGAAKQFWETIDNWDDENSVIEIPSSFKTDNSVQGNDPTPPQCIIERLALSPSNYDPKTPSDVEAFTITARGFSPDYSVNEDGTVIRGSVVWVQSTIQVTPDV